jgi:hypothetical protein
MEEYMINVEGYKAFHGDMKITPKNALYRPFFICDKDWLYKPDTGCWYGNGSSYPAEICEPFENN